MALSAATVRRLLAAVRVGAAAWRLRGRDAAQAPSLSRLATDAWQAYTVLRWVAIVVLVVAFLVVRSQASASTATSCASRPDPVLVVILQDGTTIGADRVEYDPAARAVRLFDEFCNGFEGSPE